MNAINRAALNLESCFWQFDGETLVIASASSERRYTVPTEGRQFYVGGTGYVYFDVCAGDGAHFTRKAG